MMPAKVESKSRAQTPIVLFPLLEIPAASALAIVGWSQPPLKYQSVAVDKGGQ
jgi:hypothetical protein